MSEVEVAPAQYKESGVEWLELVPNSWDIKRLKDIAIIETGSKNTEDKEDNGKYPFFVRSQTVEFIGSYSFNGEAILTAGDGVGVGKVFHHYKGKFETHQRVYRISGFHKVNGRFLFHFIQANLAKEVLKFNVKATVDSLRMPMFQRFPVILPPLPEQAAIAEYIDIRTAAVDRKIDLLGQKIKLYQTLRKTLINNTVCRGLFPHAPRKDSGIEWIGEIPAHWQVKRFKSFAFSVKGKAAEGFDEQLPDTLPVLSLDYLRNETSYSTTYLAPTNKAALVTSDDYIIIWDGAGVGEMLKGKTGILSSTIAKLVFDKKVMHADFCYFLRAAIEHITKGIPAGMGIPHLNPVVLNTFPCPCPPLEEQLQIIAFLKEKTSKMDTITTNLTTQIVTLKELRKTLINDVVTGKLNVTA